LRQKVAKKRKILAKTLIEWKTLFWQLSFRPSGDKGTKNRQGAKKKKKDEAKTRLKAHLPAKPGGRGGAKKKDQSIAGSHQ